MAILPIRIYGDPVLRKKSEPVTEITPELRQLAKDMLETMYDAPGCGLAAPQIGVSRRVVIVDGTGMEDMYPYLKDFKRVIINPEILERSEKTCEYNEGCLSIPGIYADVTRPASIKLKYYNENLEPVTEEFERFAARMVQHELSHLDGDLFTDHVAPIRRKILSKKLQNIAHGRTAARYATKIK